MFPTGFHLHCHFDSELVHLALQSCANYDYGPNISLRKSETLNSDCDDATNIVIVGLAEVCASR